MKHDCAAWTVGDVCRICGVGVNLDYIMGLLVEPTSNVEEGLEKLNELIKKHNILVEVVRNNAVSIRGTTQIFMEQASGNSASMD
jgi:hypothetical protein